jgi:regulatory protein
VGKPAFERALEALSHRERTSAELVAWLRDRDYEPGEVADAVERLTEAGALDDERFAREFAADKRDLSGWGPERIRGALTQRGLDARVIEGALAADGPGEQLERAIAILERRGEAPDDERSRARALAYLARRGYDSEIAYEAVRGFERRAA